MTAHELDGATVGNVVAWNKHKRCGFAVGASNLPVTVALADYRHPVARPRTGDVPHVEYRLQAVNDVPVPHKGATLRFFEHVHKKGVSASNWHFVADYQREKLHADTAPEYMLLGRYWESTGPVADPQSRAWVTHNTVCEMTVWQGYGVETLGDIHLVMPSQRMALRAFSRCGFRWMRRLRDEDRWAPHGEPWGEGAALFELPVGATRDSSTSPMVTVRIPTLA